jgi:hypothetical protein
VQSPFTANPVDAFSIAQTTAAGALTAVLLIRPLRPLVSSVLLLLAIWLTALLPDGIAFVTGLGVEIHDRSLTSYLGWSAFLATAAMVIARPHWVGAIALVGEIALHKVSGWVVDADQGLCVAHLVWFGMLLGIHQLLAERKAVTPAARSGWRFDPSHFLRQDIALAALAIVLASLVAKFVTLGECGSADEWAYTYQAALFAKLHAYGRAPPCPSAFHNFWIFSAGGRMFSQYPPGWPLFMAPFVALGAPWLAAPFSLGLLVVGIARLARRASLGASGRPDVVDAAGPVAAMFTMTSSTVLINSASRYSHVFSCACFAWAVESVAAITARDSASTRERQVSGVILGVSASWLLATRVGDGVTLGWGIFLCFLFGLLRGRLSLRVVAATTVAFVLWGGLSLVILRLQLGRWFVTGYSLAHDYYDWVQVKFSAPKPEDIRWALPIGTGSYCWWPLSPALGIGGLIAALRPRGRSVSFALVTGTLALLVLNYFLEFGRGWDFGYGPRYFLQTIVGMAVGTGVMLAPLWAAAQRHLHERRALVVGGPALLVIAAAVTGAVRLAPLLYPYTYEDTHARNGLNEAVRKSRLENAIVWIEPGTSVADSRDLTQNYPLDLYPSDALLLIDAGQDARRCVTSYYPRRRQYRATGYSHVQIVPE